MSSSQRTVSRSLLAFMADVSESAIEFGKLWSALATGYGSAYGRGGSGYVAELKQLRSEADLRQRLRELARRRYIKLRRASGKLIVSLTDKGYIASFINRLRVAKKHPRGWYTVVVFDIPEQLRQVRNQFRSTLRQGGFIRLQQSVWVSPADNYEIMTDFVIRTKATAWVNVYRATDFLEPPRL